MKPPGRSRGKRASKDHGDRFLNEFGEFTSKTCPHDLRKVKSMNEIDTFSDKQS
jgi:hypothetical protein